MKQKKPLSATEVFHILRPFEGEEYAQLYKLFSGKLSEDDQKELTGYQNGTMLPSLSYDVIAKKIFNPDEHGERLGHLLKGILRESNIEIDAGSLQEGYIKSEFSKRIVMDIPANLVDGRFVDTEIQQFSQDFILKRGDIYSADMLMIQFSNSDGQKKKEIGYDNVKGTILVCLMKKSPKFFADHNTERYIHTFASRTSDTGISYNTLEKIVYVQLDKCLQQLRTGKNSENDDFLQLLLSMMADINDPIVRKKAEKYDITKDILSEIREMTQNKEVQKMILAEKYATADYYSAVYYAKAEGEAEGEAKGEAKRALQVYKNCKERGMSEEDSRAISGYEGQ